MIEITVLKTRVKVSPLFFAVLTAFLLADKSGIGSMAIIFSALHETGHFAALAVLGIRAKSVKISLFGIEMKLPANLEAWEKYIVFSAGFAVNFILAAVLYFIGKTDWALINFFIGSFTAFPLSSTDGGSILKVFLEENFPEKSERVFVKITMIFAFAFLPLLIFTVFLTKNYFILIAVVYIVFCSIKNAA